MFFIKDFFFLYFLIVILKIFYEKIFNFLLKRGSLLLKNWMKNKIFTFLLELRTVF